MRVGATVEMKLPAASYGVFGEGEYRAATVSDISRNHWAVFIDVRWMFPRHFSWEELL